jgi:uridylate kinase
MHRGANRSRPYSDSNPDNSGYKYFQIQIQIRMIFNLELNMNMIFNLEPNMNMNAYNYWNLNMDTNTNTDNYLDPDILKFRYPNKMSIVCFSIEFLI